ncbi:MAG: phosphotransferase [Sporichthyaceae bacterium]|nr:phosphotransferase [Sporichthyaceae bacterium]
MTTDLILEQALRRVGLDTSDLSVTHVDHNRWLTAGIWQISTSEGSRVLKYLSAHRDPGETQMTAHWTAGSGAAAHWNYWAREGLAYQHRLPDAYGAAGIVAPEVLAVDRTDTDIVLLLEFVAGEPGDRWDVADYADAAMALGRAQGPFAARRPVPGFDWLSRRFLRDYSTEKPVDWSLLSDDRAWDQPLIRRNFPTELREAASRLHESRERLYTIMESLPRTLCHLDFWTKNLIRRPDGTIALLDWAFVGDGALGEDVGNLIPDAALDHFVAAADLPALEAAVFDGYLKGIQDAGWTGDARLIQLGMWASAVKYDWQTPSMLAAASAPVQLRYGGAGQIDADYRFRERGLALLHNARNARRALTLAEALGGLG